VLTRLSSLVQAAGSAPVRERVSIQSFDLRRGVATLVDGRQVLLPNPNSVAAPPIEQLAEVIGQGSEVDLTMSRLPDGSLVAQAANPVLSVSPALALKLDPRCLRLRVVPANPGLPDFDLGTRYHLRGYKWGFSEDLSHHFLEFGMALAVQKINCLNEVPGAYKHWLRLDRDGDNDGVFGLMVAEFTETSPPYVLKTPFLPPYHPFPILVREYRAPVLAGGGLGQPELLGEETLVVEFRDWGEYAEAFYDRTLFEIPDWPNTTTHQAAQVNDLALQFPLTLKPLNQHTFTAWSYKAIGNGTTYPTIYPIHLNEPFAVHFQDPNNQSFFAYSNDVGRALYGPTLSGLNHGKPYSYRVTLPKIVRDRLHECAGTDSYYRIPFIGPLAPGFYGSWRVSQGNNGDFTHNGWQKYAWDFPKSSGTPVLAARGGVVVDTRESGSKSCWDEDEEKCIGCSGSKAGNFVKILHQDGTAGVYVHFKYNGVAVTKDQRVYRGDTLGYVGSTGCSTGPHLHFHVLTDPDTNQTIPARFEAYDDDFDFRSCYLPPSDSEGYSTNKPWWWPF
jgi:murein DD-endopeptidase MepM/ murein hydrolase activator NlpD